MIDRDSLNRRAHRRAASGEANGRARFTNAEALLIRRSRASVHFLAHRYGCGVATISRIKQSKTYKTDPTQR